MIAALLLIAAAAPTAIDAERAFAADAQSAGKWTAFRKWADKDALMFIPQAVPAQQFLMDRKDPPKSVRWWPAHSFVSCDGGAAVNTGPWIGTNNRHGYFTTVWERSRGQWHWTYDGGDVVSGPLPQQSDAKVHRASCSSGKLPGATFSPLAKHSSASAKDTGRGQSADRTLGWEWKIDKKGARKFRVYQWNGLRYAQVLYNDIPGS